MLFLDALAIVDITDPLAFHDAARASLVSHAEEIDTFEAVFARFWRERPTRPSRRVARRRDRRHATATAADDTPAQASIAEAGVTRRSPDDGPPSHARSPSHLERGRGAATEAVRSARCRRDGAGDGR